MSDRPSLVLVNSICENTLLCTLLSSILTQTPILQSSSLYSPDLWRHPCLHSFPSPSLLLSGRPQTHTDNYKASHVIVLKAYTLNHVRQCVCVCVCAHACVCVCEREGKEKEGVDNEGWHLRETRLLQWLSIFLSFFWPSTHTSYIYLAIVVIFIWQILHEQWSGKEK